MHVDHLLRAPHPVVFGYVWDLVEKKKEGVRKSTGKITKRRGKEVELENMDKEKGNKHTPK